MNYASEHLPVQRLLQKHQWIRWHNRWLNRKLQTLLLTTRLCSANWTLRTCSWNLDDSGFQDYFVPQKALGEKGQPLFRWLVVSVGKRWLCCQCSMLWVNLDHLWSYSKAYVCICSLLEIWSAIALVLWILQQFMQSHSLWRALSNEYTEQQTVLTASCWRYMSLLVIIHSEKQLLHVAYIIAENNRQYIIHSTNTDRERIRITAQQAYLVDTQICSVSEWVSSFLMAHQHN